MRFSSATVLLYTVLLFTVLFVTAAACSPGKPTDYSEQTRDAFLASCAEPLKDALLRIELCQCIFDESQKEIPYERFEKIEADLVLDPAAPLPAQFNEIVADCVISIADL